MAYILFFIWLALMVFFGGLIFFAYRSLQRILKMGKETT